MINSGNKIINMIIHIRADAVGKNDFFLFWETNSCIGHRCLESLVLKYGILYKIILQ